MSKCSDRIYESWDSRKADLWELLERIRRGSDKAMTEMLEYPLWESEVANDGETYYLYQISCGGPQEEIRFHHYEDCKKVWKIEFCLFDWSDGAKILVTEDKVAKALWDFLSEM